MVLHLTPFTREREAYLRTAALDSYDDMRALQRGFVMDPAHTMKARRDLRLVTLVLTLFPFSSRASRYATRGTRHLRPVTQEQREKYSGAYRFRSELWEASS